MNFTVTAGHGGSDPGNTWGGHHEAKLMTELRFLVALKLRQAGHMVREDGLRGENWSLRDAMGLVAGADLALELHTNAAANPSAAGVEVLADLRHADPAKRIARAIGGVLQIPTRRQEGWYPHVDFIKSRGHAAGFVRMGGLIVEVFFQSNPEELRRYLERRWLVASAIASAMDDPS